MKYRPKWCPNCQSYLPHKGASSHKCLFKGEVLIGESRIKCRWLKPIKPMGSSIYKECSRCGQPLESEIQYHTWESCLLYELNKYRQLLNKPIIVIELEAEDIARRRRLEEVK